jgi:hypothetical protein
MFGPIDTQIGPNMVDSLNPVPKGSTERGCTLRAYETYNLYKVRKSVNLCIWAALGDPSKRWVPPFGRVPGPPPRHQNERFPILIQINNSSQIAAT